MYSFHCLPLLVEVTVWGHLEFLAASLCVGILGGGMDSLMVGDDGFNAGMVASLVASIILAAAVCQGTGTMGMGVSGDDGSRKYGGSDMVYGFWVMILG